MAERLTTEKAASERAAASEAADAQRVDAVTVPADVEKRPAGTKAYVSDRNLAEFNAGEVVYLDPKSDLGKRLIATGYLEEVEDPLA